MLSPLAIACIGYKFKVYKEIIMKFQPVIKVQICFFRNSYITCMEKENVEWTHGYGGLTVQEIFTVAISYL